MDTLVREIASSLEADINTDSLKADEVVTDLLCTATLINSEEELIKKAQVRMALGNPPGKKGSLGDALNWESLLKAVPNDKDFIIISSDGDYESPFSDTKTKEYLTRGWAEKKKSRITLYKSLPAFLQANFPHIKLSDEIGKLTAIERLEHSGSFSETHTQVSKLDKISDLSEHELEHMLKAYLENDQIYWILDDSDVLIFAKKIIKLAGKRSSDFVNELQAKVDEVEEIQAGLEQ